MSFQFEYEKELEAKDKRIAELEGVTQFLDEQRHAMGDLLDRVPHLSGCDTYPTMNDRCLACAWARMKEGK